MASEPAAALAANNSLRTTHVYGAAALSLILGLAIGYLFQGQQSSDSHLQSAAFASRTAASGSTIGQSEISQPALAGSGQANTVGQAHTAAHTAMPGVASGMPHGGHLPSWTEMKQMADKQTAPLLEKLKRNPSDSALLVQIGAIYHATHQFHEAASYYAKAAQADPRNVAIRTKLAASLYRSGDVDGAIAELNRALHNDPNDANALFDLGTIRLQGKQDGKGALIAWRQLLKSNPQLSTDRRAMVEKLMASVLTTLNYQHGTKGARTNDASESH